MGQSSVRVITVLQCFIGGRIRKKGEKKGKCYCQVTFNTAERIDQVQQNIWSFTFFAGTLHDAHKTQSLSVTR